MSSSTLNTDQSLSDSDQPLDVIKDALRVISELVLRRNDAKPTRDAAVSTILQLVEQLVSENATANAEAMELRGDVASLRSQIRSLRDSLSVERRSRQIARNTADHNETMANVVRDLTRIFRDQEFEFRQVDTDGNEYRITGYTALDLRLSFSEYSAEVRNTTRNRKTQVFYFDRSGLTAETFTAIEALFQVELTKGNTPSRAHGTLFEDETAVPDGFPGLSLGVMMSSADCGDPNCLLHGPNGVLYVLQNGGSVSDVVNKIMEKLAATGTGYAVNTDEVPFGLGDFPRNY